MTSYEMLTLIVSGVAIFVSVVSPFVSYYVLDPQFQAFKNRGRLQVEDSYAVSTELIPAKSAGEIPRIVTHTLWLLSIKNIGSLPAKDVQIDFKYEQPITEMDAEPTLEVDPPIPIERSVQKDQITFKFTKPIAPGVEISVRGMEPDETRAYTEFGDISVVRTAKGRERFLKLAAGESIPIICPVR